MTSQLTLYNGALRFLGERELADLSENREPRRLLDGVYGDDAIKRCLAQGLWTFAARSAKVTYDSSITTQFGYARAFPQPSDFVRTINLSLDPYFYDPLTQYLDEAGVWYADSDTIYAKWVSNDSAYGGDLSKWPPLFTEYVEGYLGIQIAPKLTGKDVDKLEKRLEERLNKALNVDAMNQPPQFAPAGSWVRARHRRFASPDNARTSLIG